MPTLNKRRISVLAYHYDVEDTDRDIVVSPHEIEWEYAFVERVVENAKSNNFFGTGAVYVERGDDVEIQLKLAETRP